ncbi:hypothetical protein [Pseudooctadecabacter jejudonensis]|uniref:Uncharacterized protein n=1 Tax=Pseudooctadecabacter jejudonensis TaxID=1391910 RepID=A0A1Y5RLG3_9RHOB|nr:hypothetical protein [Pseudooctadecabacter jejudonensis]SLN19174.1 hypothetical protein PSJ8397_00659 [Pseudooctadecabacter jejudonensis]
MKKGDPLDPKGLIADAYRIEGITSAECRSIFLDWALSYADTPQPAIEALLTRHASQPGDHPMTQTLQQGLDTPQAPKRRGGRAARVLQ